MMRLSLAQKNYLTAVLYSPFPSDQELPMLAIHVPKAQVTHLSRGHTDIMEYPENGLIAHSGSISHGATVIWELAGLLPAVKFRRGQQAEGWFALRSNA